MKNALISVGLWALSGLFSIDAFASPDPNPLPAPIFNNIGDGSFRADTEESLAQKYFNQGMVFFYGFDYLEAIRSFEASLKLDPNCSRCKFGLALSLGSVTNAFIKGDEIDRANKILAKAKSSDLVTQGLFDALRLRYQHIVHEQINESMEPHCAQGAIELPSKNKLAFSDALFALTQKFPDEQTILALFAYSVLGTDNWDLYDSLLDIKPYANMMIAVSQQLLKLNPDHVGGIHYFIHATEWSKDPAQSLKYAEKLASLAPLAEHLVHMPTHIYLRLGDYNKAVTKNLEAVKVFGEYEALCHQQGFKPVENFLNQHNYDFLFTSATFAGRADVAYQTAENIRQETPLNWLDKHVFFQRFYALKFYAIAHFGGWDQLKPLEKPLQKYPYLNAMWAYTKALQALTIHDLNGFEVFFKKFNQASKENNSHEAYQKAFANNLAIAKEVLLANKERQTGHWEDAILHWHKAASLQKAGGDPPEWYFPTILGLGYTFLDAGKSEQAALTFEASLIRNPENGWALYGLAMAYTALGQTEKANEFESRFKKIWHPQSVPLPIKEGSDLFLSASNK